jgi:hypothetical protein
VAPISALFLAPYLAIFTRRWVGTVLLEAEKRFHRVQGYPELPLLINALGNAVDSEEAVA